MFGGQTVLSEPLGGGHGPWPPISAYGRNPWQNLNLGVGSFLVAAPLPPLEKFFPSPCRYPTDPNCKLTLNACQVGHIFITVQRRSRGRGHGAMPPPPRRVGNGFFENIQVILLNWALKIVGQIRRVFRFWKGQLGQGRSQHFRLVGAKLSMGPRSTLPKTEKSPDLTKYFLRRAHFNKKKIEEKSRLPGGQNFQGT